MSLMSKSKVFKIVPFLIKAIKNLLVSVQKRLVRLMARIQWKGGEKTCMK